MILCILLFKRSKNILKRKHRVDRGIEIGNVTVIYDIYKFNNRFWNFQWIQNICLLIFKPKKRIKSICQKIVTLEQQEKQNTMKGIFTKKIWSIWENYFRAINKRLMKTSYNVYFVLGEQKDGHQLVELLHGWLLLHRLEVEHSSFLDWDCHLETIGRISGLLPSYFLLWRPCWSPNLCRLREYYVLNEKINSLILFKYLLFGTNTWWLDIRKLFSWCSLDFVLDVFIKRGWLMTSLYLWMKMLQHYILIRMIQQ